MLANKHLPVAIDFHSVEKNTKKSMTTGSCLVGNILQNIIFVFRFRIVTIWVNYDRILQNLFLVNYIFKY